MTPAEIYMIPVSLLAGYGGARVILRDLPAAWRWLKAGSWARKPAEAEKSAVAQASQAPDPADRPAPEAPVVATPRALAIMIAANNVRGHEARLAFAAEVLPFLVRAGISTPEAVFIDYYLPKRLSGHQWALAAEDYARHLWPHRFDQGKAPTIESAVGSGLIAAALRAGSWGQRPTPRELA